MKSILPNHTSPLQIGDERTPRQDRSFADNMFNIMFRKCKTILPYNPSWMNSKGFFEALVQDEEVKKQLTDGAMAISIDDEGRRMIIINTLFGNVVVFQSSDDDNRTYYFNAPPELTKFGFIRSVDQVTEEDMLFIVGDTWSGGKNIGENIHEMARLLQEMHQ